MAAPQQQQYVYLAMRVEGNGVPECCVSRTWEDAFRWLLRDYLKAECDPLPISSTTLWQLVVGAAIDRPLQWGVEVAFDVEGTWFSVQRTPLI
jgi:hypothetical protein